MADIFDLFKKISKSEAEPQTPIKYIVAGLGNPGREYAYTRHNAGFLAADFLADKYGASVTRAKFEALVGDTVIRGERVLFMKPQTMMNLSGEAVARAADFYRIPPENVIVIFDDISLEPGRLRVRRKGSDGGHNGIKSVIRSLGSDGFPRIKIGVGQKPHPDYDLAAWVLSELPESDRKKIFDSFGRLSEGLENIIAGDVEAAMQICNGAC